MRSGCEPSASVRGLSLDGSDPSLSFGIMEEKMETTVVYGCDVGIMEKEMETTIVYWGSIGIMEKKMETTL